MDDSGAQTEDHAHAPVPDEDRMSGVRLALILSNTVVCVPNLLLATQIAQGAGLPRALQSFWIGGAALAAMGAATAIVGARSNLSTSMILRFPFGRRGGLFVNVVLLVSILGLYSVTAAVFGNAMANTVERVTGWQGPVAPFTVIGSGLMILVVIFGVRSLGILASVAVPLLVLLTVTMLARSFGHAAPDIAGGEPLMSSSTAISAVIGSYILGIIVMPDMIRFVRTAREGAGAAVFALAVALPLFLSIGAMIGSSARASTLSALLIALGLGASALAILTLVSWTNNANNLYSTSLVFAAIVPRVAKWRLVAIAGTAGTLLALLPVVSHYVPFLSAISILLPPLAGIYVADHWLVRGGRYDLATLEAQDGINIRNLLIWAIAVGIGTLTATGCLMLTSIPGLDSMLASVALHALSHIGAAARRADVTR